MNKKNAQPERIQPGTSKIQPNCTPQPAEFIEVTAAGEDSLLIEQLGRCGGRRLRRIAAAMQQWEARKGRGRK